MKRYILVVPVHSGVLSGNQSLNVALDLKRMMPLHYSEEQKSHGFISIERAVGALAFC